MHEFFDLTPDEIQHNAAAALKAERERRRRTEYEDRLAKVYSAARYLADIFNRDRVPVEYALDESYVVAIHGRFFRRGRFERVGPIRHGTGWEIHRDVITDLGDITSSYTGGKFDDSISTRAVSTLLLTDGRIAKGSIIRAPSDDIKNIGLLSCGKDEGIVTFPQHTAPYDFQLRSVEAGLRARGRAHLPEC